LKELDAPRGRNLPIDSFFRALAKDQGAHEVCIILSGTGTDGTLGLKAIKGEVGMVMVQDEKSAKYEGMPHSAITTGLVDYVLPPEKMPAQLINYTQHAAYHPLDYPETHDTPNALQKVYMILRSRTDHDFSLYKKNTICRRIERRMNVHQIADITEYVRYLEGSEREVDILFKELLIGVTHFFRDTEAFENLQHEILPELLRDKPEGYTVRAWVAGCSTGEEAYSLAIILEECAEQTNRHFNVQIFGTDIDDEAVRIARAGIYSESMLIDVSPERLKRHFTKEDNGKYRVRKPLRERLVFATQNLFKDPPFTKLDVISCRNLLIYFSAELQRKLIPIFHYALHKDGVLILGSSESIGTYNELFENLDKKWKIFKKLATSESNQPYMGRPNAIIKLDTDVPRSIRQAEEVSALQLVETILQESATPPCAIIDNQSNVVYIHGRIGRYLEPPQGKISVNILEMARRGLRAELALAIRKVATHKQEIIHRGLRIDHEAVHIFVDITVRPVLEQSAIHGLMMVIFEDGIEARKPEPESIRNNTPGGKSVEALQQELHYTRDNLQTTIELLETSNEELKSTNEELQSTNEELQSTNEEMETSKEELQSLHEETITVNGELQCRMDELSATNDDMKNLLDSTDIATLFLDSDLCIRRFTPKATGIVPLANTDTGRPIRHFATSLKHTNLEEYGKMVLSDLIGRDVEGSSEDGRIYAVKFRPYRTVNNVIDGIVVTFDDITVRKQAEAALAHSEEKFRTLVEASIDCVWEIDAGGIYTYVGPQVEHLLGYQPEAIVGLSLFDLMNPEEAKRAMGVLKKLMLKGHPISEVRHIAVHKTGQAIELETRGLPYFDLAGKVAGYRGVHRDISRGQTVKEPI
jgi:two-component system, chemotaxis family, CheB/CheR fusion protein